MIDKMKNQQDYTLIHFVVVVFAVVLGICVHSPHHKGNVHVHDRYKMIPFPHMIKVQTEQHKLIEHIHNTKQHTVYYMQTQIHLCVQCPESEKQFRTKLAHTAFCEMHY